MQVVKRIFRYIMHIVDFGLRYPRGKYFILATYINASWVGSVVDRKRISGGSFFIGNSLVSWLSKTRALISLSTVEVEYATTISCCTQVLWMKQILKNVKVEFDNPISILCENTNEHIPIKYHFLREQVAQQHVRIE